MFWQLPLARALGRRNGPGDSRRSPPAVMIVLTKSSFWSSAVRLLQRLALDDDLVLDEEPRPRLLEVLGGVERDRAQELLGVGQGLVEETLAFLEEVPGPVIFRVVGRRSGPRGNPGKSGSTGSGARSTWPPGCIFPARSGPASSPHLWRESNTGPRAMSKTIFPAYFLRIEAATTLATLLRMAMMSPLSSGWTRFVRKMTAVCVSGSIQIDVPV